MKPTQDEQPHLKQHILGAYGTNGAKDDEDLGPCASRPSPKWLTGLHVYTGPTGARSFPFHQLDHAEFADDGRSFKFIFAGIKHWALTVRGTNLWRLYDYIHSHRLYWIRKSDRGFGDDKMPFIEKIELQDVTPIEED